MADLAKFLFDQPFDTAAGTPAARGNPRITPEDLAEAVAAARNEGDAEGYARGKAESEAQLAAVTATAAAELARISETQAETRRTLDQHVIELARAIAGKLAGALIRREPAAEIEALIRQCLADLHGEPRMAVRMAAPMVEAFRDRVDAMAVQSGFAGKVVLLADDTLDPLDCRIEWADGGAERTQATIEARIEATIARHLQRNKD